MGQSILQGNGSNFNKMVHCFTNKDNEDVGTIESEILNSNGKSVTYVITISLINSSYTWGNSTIYGSNDKEQWDELATVGSGNTTYRELKSGTLNGYKYYKGAVLVSNNNNFATALIYVNEN